MMKNKSLIKHQISCQSSKRISAGPESLDDYFQKGALSGQKAALYLWYVDTGQISQKLFPSIRRSVIFGL